MKGNREREEKEKNAVGNIIPAKITYPSFAGVCPTLESRPVRGHKPRTPKADAAKNAVGNIILAKITYPSFAGVRPTSGTWCLDSDIQHRGRARPKAGL